MSTQTQELVAPEVGYPEAAIGAEFVQLVEGLEDMVAAEPGLAERIAATPVAKRPSLHDLNQAPGHY